jgi:hypothetical protein
MRPFLLCAVSFALLSSGVAAQSERAEPPLQWFPAPLIFPPGAQIAVVSGNPARPGRFTAELSLPDGYRWPPHSHMADEFLEVKRGTFLFGMGDAVDLAKARPMSAADTATAVAGMHHYGVAPGCDGRRNNHHGPLRYQLRDRRAVPTTLPSLPLLTGARSNVGSCPPPSPTGSIKS